MDAEPANWQAPRSQRQWGLSSRCRHFEQKQCRATMAPWLAAALLVLGWRSPSPPAPTTEKELWGSSSRGLRWQARGPRPPWAQGAARPEGSFTSGGLHCPQVKAPLRPTTHMGTNMGKVEKSDWRQGSQPFRAVVRTLTHSHVIPEYGLT